MKDCSIAFLFLLISLAFYHSTQAQIITTFGGNGSIGYLGDGVPATTARLNLPADVAIDKDGNVYIAAYWDCAVRKVNRYGIIATVAGNGAVGYSGDGGLAVLAKLHGPAAVAVDRKGNVYIADLNNARIRKVDTNGIITTIAGTGVAGYGGDGGPAIAAQLNWPQGIAVDTIGNVYVADELNNRIRKIDTFGIITTVAGTDVPGSGGDGGAAVSAQLHYPVAVKVAHDGYVYIVDYANNRIRRISPSGIISAFAGTDISGYSGDGGPALSATLDSPDGLAIDGLGNVYIADGGNSVIRKVDASGIITTVAGNGIEDFAGDGGLATLASLKGPEGLAVDSVGNLYIADVLNQRVRRVSGIHGSLSVCQGSTCSLHDDFAGGTWISSAPSVATVGSGSGLVLGVATGTAVIYYVRAADTAFTTMTVVDTLPTVAPITGPSVVCTGSAITLSETATAGTWSATNGKATVVGGIVTGAYVGVDTVIYTNANACGVAADSVIITVNGANADVITGTATICVGDTTILYDTVAGGVWGSDNTSIALALGGGAVIGVAPGIDTVRYVVSHLGCYDTAFYIMHVWDPPSAGVITGASVLCAGATTALVDTVTGGVWSASNSSATVIGGIVTGMASGIDTIRYSKSNACSVAVASFVVTVNAAVAGMIIGPSSVCPGGTVTLTNTTSGGTWSVSNTTMASISGSGALLGIVAGPDTVRYIANNMGCSDTAFYPVTILEAPSAGVITGDTAICLGGTGTLTSSLPGGSWSTWSGNATVVDGVLTGVAVGFDTVTYVHAGVCGSAAAHIPITINTATAGVITGANTMCPGDTVLLSDTVSGGVWSNSGTAATLSIGDGLIVAVTPGVDTINYRVTYMGCSDTVSLPIVVRALEDCDDKVPNQGNLNDVEIYPVPTQGVFFVKLPHSSEIVTATLYDLCGKTILTEKLIATSTPHRFNLTDQPRGIYLLSIQLADNIYRYKITLE